MAPLRCALLSALTLAADGSLARRLSEPPEACVQACPKVVEFAADMEIAGLGHHDDDRSTTTMAEEDHTTLADELAIDFSPTPAPDFVGTEALKAMKAMCQQQDVISCLEENLGACELVPEDFEEVKSHLACTCELCPGIVETQVDIADMLMGALQKELSDGHAGSPQEQDELKGKPVLGRSKSKWASPKTKSSLGDGDQDPKDDDQNPEVVPPNESWEENSQATIETEDVPKKAQWCCIEPAFCV